MKIYNRLCDGICRVLIAVCSVLMVILLSCSALQVVSRYVFGSSFTWTEEAARYCFIWIDMMGAAALVYKGGHAVVDVFVQKLAGTARKIYETIVHLLVLYVGLVLARFGYELSMITINQTSPSLKLPMGVVYGIVPFCGLLIFVFSANLMINVWVGHRSEKEEVKG